MQKLLVTVILMLGLANANGQGSWDISKRDREILIDGFLDEWNSVASFQISPETTGIKSSGEFSGKTDLSLSLQALWDEEYLYLAVTWEDDTWDIEEVTRRDAVWIDSTNKRRDRMQFFDNLKLQIRKSDYDYTLWISPRIEDEGPYHWNRLLEGYKGMERATGAPMLSAREHPDSATLEIMLLWKQLKLNPKKERTLPLMLVVADSDNPDRLLEYKLGFLKWLGWVGQIKILD